MKYTYLILLLTLIIFAISCNQPKTQGTINRADSLKLAIANDYTYDKHHDSINLSISNHDIILYSKKSLDSVITFYPELLEYYAEHPDIMYAKRKPSKLALDKGFSFESEVGQDSYYEIYAYILNLQTQLKQYSTEKQKLSIIYQDINYIYQKLQQGGTYYGHTYARIPAYIMYSLKRYDNHKSYFVKDYSIIKQRKLYINSLKQYINDELDNSFEFMPKEKTELKKELFETVFELDRSITEYFYLKEAQEFQYAHY